MRQEKKCKMQSKHLELVENQMGSLTLRSRLGFLRRQPQNDFRGTSVKRGTKPTDIKAISIAIYCFIYKLKHMFLDLCSPPPLLSSTITTLIYCNRICPTLCLLFPFICLNIISIATHWSFKVSLQTCPLTAHPYFYAELFLSSSPSSSSSSCFLCAKLSVPLGPLKTRI